MAHAGAAGCCCRRYSLLWIALLQRSVTRLSETGKECGARPRAGIGGRAAPSLPSRCRAQGQRCPGQPPHDSGSRRAALSPGLSQENEGGGRDRRDEARGERLGDRGARGAAGREGEGDPRPRRRARCARCPPSRARAPGAAGPGRSAQLQRSQWAAAGRSGGGAGPGRGPGAVGPGVPARGGGGGGSAAWPSPSGAVARRRRRGRARALRVSAGLRGRAWSAPSCAGSATSVPGPVPRAAGPARSPERSGATAAGPERAGGGGRAAGPGRWGRGAGGSGAGSAPGPPGPARGCAAALRLSFRAFAVCFHPWRRFIIRGRARQPRCGDGPCGSISVWLVQEDTSCLAFAALSRFRLQTDVTQNLGDKNQTLHTHPAPPVEGGDSGVQLGAPREFSPESWQGAGGSGSVPASRFCFCCHGFAPDVEA